MFQLHFTSDIIPGMDDNQLQEVLKEIHDERYEIFLAACDKGDIQDSFLTFNENGKTCFTKAFTTLVKDSGKDASTTALNNIWNRARVGRKQREIRRAFYAWVIDPDTSEMPLPLPDILGEQDKTKRLVYQVLEKEIRWRYIQSVLEGSNFNNSGVGLEFHIDQIQKYACLMSLSTLSNFFQEAKELGFNIPKLQKMLQPKNLSAIYTKNLQLFTEDSFYKWSYIENILGEAIEHNADESEIERVQGLLDQNLQKNHGPSKDFG